MPHRAGPKLSDIEVARYAPGFGHAASDWQRALDALSNPRVLKTTSEGHAAVWRGGLEFPAHSKIAGSPPGADVVLKIEPLPTLHLRLRALMRHTRHHRQWRGYEKLARRGLLAARPLAILRARTAQGYVEVLVLEHVPGQTLLELLASFADGRPLPAGLVGQLGTLVRSFETAGLWNRDPKPSNIVVDEGSHGACRCVFIDTVGIERRPAGRPGFLRHLLRLLLLETRGTGIDCPPQFAEDLATEVIAMRLVDRREHDRNADPGEAPELARDLLAAIEIEIADTNATPLDEPLPPKAP